MYSRWFSVTVVLFWLVTMSWLVGQKVLPSLMVGTPPTYQSIVEDHAALAQPVSWTIALNDKPLGTAESWAKELDNGVTEFHSRVRLDELPLAELTPGWVKSLLRVMDGSQELEDLTVQVDVESDLEIDPLGRPIGFNSVATFGGQASSLKAVLQGVVEGRRVKLKVKSGEFVYNTDAFLPTDSLMSDALSPQTRLPDLKVGQSWTVPVYSPLRPTDSLEVLHAKVERREPIVWRNRVVPAYLIVLRSDPGSELSNAQAAKAKVWVDLDGNVLRQELMLLASRLTFERSSEVGVDAPNTARRPWD